jgi:hypothetical protein
VSPDADGVAAEMDCNGDASPCSAVGTSEVSCDSNACVFVAADVAVARASAAACPDTPPALPMGSGEVNGVKCVAVADVPA